MTTTSAPGFRPSSIKEDRYDPVRSMEIETLLHHKIESLGNLLVQHEQVLFTPCIPYAFFYENGIEQTPIFGDDVPSKYVRQN